MASALAIFALVFGVIVSFQFYQDKKQEMYGTVTQTPQAISFENLELIVGFTKDDEMSLLG